MYGTAGHGKGFINAMSSFGTRNVLRRDTVTQGVFFSIKMKALWIILQ